MVRLGMFFFWCELVQAASWLHLREEWFRPWARNCGESRSQHQPSFRWSPHCSALSLPNLLDHAPMMLRKHWFFVVDPTLNRTRTRTWCVWSRFCRAHVKSVAIRPNFFPNFMLPTFGCQPATCWVTCWKFLFPLICRGCRVAGWTSAWVTCCFCVLLPAAILALTMVTIKNDKTARLPRSRTKNFAHLRHRNQW